MTISRIHSFSTAKLRRPKPAAFLKPSTVFVPTTPSSTSTKTLLKPELDSNPLTDMLRDLKLSFNATPSSTSYGLSKSKFQYSGMTSRKKSFCLFSLANTRDKKQVSRNLSPTSVIQDDSSEQIQDYGYFEDYEDSLASSFPSTAKLALDF